MSTGLEGVGRRVVESCSPILPNNLLRATLVIIPADRNERKSPAAERTNEAHLEKIVNVNSMQGRLLPVKLSVVCL